MWTGREPPKRGLFPWGRGRPAGDGGRAFPASAGPRRGSLLDRVLFLLALAQILFMLGLLRPALGGPAGLDLQPLRRRGVALRVQGRQLF